MKKTYVAILVAALALSTLFAGCGSDKAEDTQSSNMENSDNEDSNADTQETADAQGTAGVQDYGSYNGSSSYTDDVSNALQAGGRDYGQTHQLTQDDVMRSEFFNLKVNSVAAADDLEGWMPKEEDYMLLVINVSITNTFTQDIPMTNSDFPVFWNTGADSNRAYPNYSFSTALPDEYDIKVDETVEGDLIYIVPKDVDAVTIEYQDVWNDEFEGDTFRMVINVK